MTAYLSGAEFGMLAVLTLAVCAATITLTKSSMFKWLRDLAWKTHRIVGKMSSCPYCMSHWIALIAVGVYQPRPVAFLFPVDMIVSWLAIIALAALFNGIVLLITPFAIEERDV